MSSDLASYEQQITRVLHLMQRQLEAAVHVIEIIETEGIGRDSTALCDAMADFEDVCRGSGGSQKPRVVPK